MVVPERFSASSFWGDVARHGVTWYSAVPTIHQILLLRADADAAPRRSSLRFIRSCSSALAPVTLAQLEERFGAPVLEAYGMTEAAHQMASNPLPSDGERRPGTVGRGTNVLIGILPDDGDTPLPEGTVGEVCIRGRNVTRGYHNNEQANRDNFTASGWFRTGDQGVLHDGYLTLTVRAHLIASTALVGPRLLISTISLSLSLSLSLSGSIEGADQPRWREDLTTRARRCAARASECRRRRRLPCSRPQVRRDCMRCRRSYVS